MPRRRSHSRPRPKDVVIAVMGPTGVGKSSFIKSVTGSEDIAIGHSLHPGTHQVTPYKITLEASGDSTHRAQTFNITILDCPGFDDPSSPDHRTIASILEFLDSRYYGQKLHGIIYMVNICNPRVRGVDRRNISMFQRLCGEDFYPNVVLCTTHWDQLQAVADGISREEQLCANSDFWGGFAASRLERVGARPHGSNQRDVKIVLDITRWHHPRELRAQKEMRHGSLPSQTAAAREEHVWNLYLTKEREQLQRLLQQEERRMRERLAENGEALQRQLEDVEATIFRAQEDLELQLARKVEELEFRRREFEGRTNGETVPVRRNTLPVTTREQERGGHMRRMEDWSEQEERLRRQLESTTQVVKDQGRALRKEVQQQCGREKQRDLTCDGRKGNMCRKNIDAHRHEYYHCCYCANDNYDHCIGCGSHCPRYPEHPKMARFDYRKPREQPWRH